MNSFEDTLIRVFSFLGASMAVLGSLNFSNWMALLGVGLAFLTLVVNIIHKVSSAKLDREKFEWEKSQAISLKVKENK